MLDRADSILKLALSVAALCLGAGVGYYYGIFLPAQADASAARLEAAEKEKQAEARRTAERIEKASADARIRYSECLIAASADYNTRWQSSCRSLNASDTKARRDCVSRGSTEEYCSTIINVRPASDCSLPTETADSYDAGHKDAKQLCMDELKASQAEVRLSM
jgi:hypothetical protein